MSIKTRTIRARTTLAWIMTLTAAAGMAVAGDNECNAPGDYPDVIVGDLFQVIKYGTVGDITAFSFGTTSCNVGTCWLDWQEAPSNQHPVIAQNLYRLKDGRFEHIGQSWLKHGFFALSGNLCFNDCQPTDGDHLGVHCSDPYSAGLNGSQPNLGPKFEVNVATGEHPHPVTGSGLSGDAIFKRLQVHNDDLNPVLNTNAQYFVEGHYVAADDAAARRHRNNASYRPVIVTGSAGDYNISLTGSTVREKAAIQAWAAADPLVQEEFIDVPGEGRFILASRVTEAGAGVWRYEYAVHNLTSHRSAMSFSVPVPAGTPLTNIGFHDVDYHSGEPYDGTDWPHDDIDDGVLTWSTGENANQNPNANALRWGTLYNFRFDAPMPPEAGTVTLELYRPGVPSTVSGAAPVPLVCDNDGTCDPGEGCGFCADCLDGECGLSEGVCSCPEDCGLPPEIELDCGNGLDDDCDGFIDCADPECCSDAQCQIDQDSDGVIECVDCDDGHAGAWDAPSEVVDLRIHLGSLLEWSPPADLGGTSVHYEVLRAAAADDFMAATCLQSQTPTGLSLVDTFLPFPGEMFAYLVRATNDCPLGYGPLGNDGNGQPRPGRLCE